MFTGAYPRKFISSMSSKMVACIKPAKEVKGVAVCLPSDHQTTLEAHETRWGVVSSELLSREKKQKPYGTRGPK